MKGGDGRSGVRNTKSEVDGVSATDGSVVGESLEGNDCVLKEKHGQRD